MTSLSNNSGILEKKTNRENVDFIQSIRDFLETWGKVENSVAIEYEDSIYTAKMLSRSLGIALFVDKEDADENYVQKRADDILYSKGGFSSISFTDNLTSFMVTINRINYYVRYNYKTYRSRVIRGLKNKGLTLEDLFA